MLKYATFIPPVTPSAGDYFVRASRSVVERWRVVDNHPRRISVHRLTFVPIVGTLAIGNQATISTIVVEDNVPGSTDSLTNVIEATDHKVTFVFASGSSNTYDSWSDAGSVAEEWDTSPSRAQQLLIAMAVRSSPGGENKTACVGASVSINVQPASVPIVYTPPQE